MRVLGSNEGAAFLVLVPAVAVVVAVAAAPMPGEAQDAGPMAEGEDAGNPVPRTRSPAAGTGDLS
ncbi:MAG TPA: hypothetical protein RMF84_17340, partial [Polyangiaceae bacterium LLY-WYZ-14_1]|nr:hypothetical protein [Polyangiaceae bacterium LLY-WYZ-14_1]